MQEQSIIATQLEFYKQGLAGCLFAAYAAQDPKRYGWKLSTCEVHAGKIETVIQTAITDPAISTQSILFPRVMDDKDLLQLLNTLLEVQIISLGQEESFEDSVCLGYRIAVNGFTSWVTGLGNFAFLPATRQAVFTEVVFRSKPRPDYDKVMKEAPVGVIHLADMDMQHMSEHRFKALWHGSFDNTERRLGANLICAAPRKQPLLFQFTTGIRPRRDD